MTPAMLTTLKDLAERRAVLARQYEDTYDEYIYARRVRLPVLQRFMGRQMQSCQAAITLHDGLIRRYREEVAL